MIYLTYCIIRKEKVFTEKLIKSLYPIVWLKLWWSETVRITFYMLKMVNALVEYDVIVGKTVLIMEYGI